MKTRKFRTRQEFHSGSFPKGKDYIIGLDSGYSGMKVFYEGGYFCFPSYAKRIDGNMLNIQTEKDILYKDLATGKTYILGYTAQNMISSTDTNDTDGEMYSRKRYTDPRFQALNRAAIAIALGKKNDNREIIVQTGLPASYVEGDRSAMEKSLLAPASFALKVGEGKWQEFELKLKPGHVFADLPQPAGILYSSLIKNDGKEVPDAKNTLLGNVLIFDGGFGTIDYYGLKNKRIMCKETIDEIGMREVMKHVTQKIRDEFHEDIRVQAMQKILEDGYVTCIDEELMKSEDRQIHDILMEASDEVFREAMDRTKSLTNTFRDYKKLIVGGGTGEAWYEKIKEYLSGLKSLEVVPCNVNDGLPFIYANARGYYMYRYSMNKR